MSKHDGVSKNKDGSDFWDIKIFKNKKDLEKYIKDLKKDGYTDYTGVISESKFDEANLADAIFKAVKAFTIKSKSKNVKPSNIVKDIQWSIK